MAPLVSVRNLSKVFSLPGGFFGKRRELRALDGISLDVEEGESLGVVGESGCGKSTLVRCIVRLLRPSAGKILFRGVDIASLSARKLRPLRKDMQIVFQDPYSSLHPRLDVETLIAEPLRLHKIGGRKSQLARVHELLAAVGLQPDILRRRPAALSGGQRQRVSIARALSLSPKLLVCDEAVSALDVSVQAQIIELLRGLQAQHGLTYLFISHDLGVIRQLCDRVVVMYLGKIVEIGKVEDLLSVPAHPYTQALIASVPEI